MSIAKEVRQSAARSGCSLRDMCEQECARKSIRLSEGKVVYTFADGSVEDSLSPSLDDISEAQ